MGKRPGGTAVKVWGILLVCLGGMGAVNMVLTLTMVFGVSSPSNFTFGLDPASKADLDRLTNSLLEPQLSSWVFWASTSVEVILAVISVLGGILLLKFRPGGARLALVRAGFAILTLPLYAAQVGDLLEAQREIHDATMEAQYRSRPELRGNKDAQEFMKAANQVGMYGGLAAGGVFALLINGLLAFMITRPTVKEYLANAATEKSHWIPGYDPSMGLLANPPGQGPPAPPSPPSPGQGPPDQPPAGPPVFSTLQNPRR